MKRLALLLLVVAVVLPSAIRGQGGATGAISGTVVDRQGTSMANAQLEIYAAGGATILRTIATDASGNFTAASLPVGAYDLVVKAPSFSTSNYSGVEVRLTETTRLNPTLLPLPESEDNRTKDLVVRISAPPPVVPVQTSNPATRRLRQCADNTNAPPGDSELSSTPDIVQRRSFRAQRLGGSRSG